MDRIDYIGNTTPEFYYKNGKKPTTIYTADGTEIVVNSTNGSKFTNTQLKQLANIGKHTMKKDALKDKMLERLEMRKAQKLLEQQNQQRLR